MARYSGDKLPSNVRVLFILLSIFSFLAMIGAFIFIVYTNDFAPANEYETINPNISPLLYVAIGAGVFALICIILPLILRKKVLVFAFIFSTVTAVFSAGGWLLLDNRVKSFNYNVVEKTAEKEGKVSENHKGSLIIPASSYQRTYNSNVQISEPEIIMGEDDYYALIDFYEKIDLSVTDYSHYRDFRGSDYHEDMMEKTGIFERNQEYMYEFQRTANSFEAEPAITKTVSCIMRYDYAEEVNKEKNYMRFYKLGHQGLVIGYFYDYYNKSLDATISLMQLRYFNNYGLPESEEFKYTCLRNDGEHSRIVLQKAYLFKYFKYVN